MIFTLAAMDGIIAGRITLAFRRWHQVRVTPGSLLRNARGVVQIVSIDAVDAGAVTADDARDAGFASVEELLHVVDRKSRGGTLFRIGVRHQGADPRRALRDRTEFVGEELDRLRARLTRMDTKSPWTRPYLELIAANPGVVARELAPRVAMERDPFKIRVRRLKDLGLTESLDVGYRISPRGQAYLDSDPLILE